MSSPQSQPDLLHQDDFWSDDFWSSHATAVDQHETGSTSDGQEVDSRVTTAEHDSSLATKPRLRLLPGGKQQPKAAKSVQTSATSAAAPSKPKPKPKVARAAQATAAAKTDRLGSAKQQLTGINLTRKAMKLAWQDTSGGKFTQTFTRTVMKLSPVFVADDALIPLTMGAATPVSLGTNVVLAIGATIYVRKVRKYRRQLSGGR